ncbi:MAG: GNAT family N-acetyltransferase [Burkholderiales bacterium]|jgi:GNAT superfamily N-acetyltransferase|nr:GNAT family N-acetyltransferase [Burkholderiales bacterium]
MDDVNLCVEGNPSKELTRALFDELFRANTERTGDGAIEQLCVVARDADGVLVGGAYGEIYWGWLNVAALWVAPSLRRRGLGTRLLALAEREAAAKGCHGVYLDSFTFQSPSLYVRAGYEIFGTLEDFPRGHARHFLRKKLRVV